jgi:hypothetical protein
MLDAKVWLDINIVGAGSYTNNNLVYLQDQSWFSLLRDLNQVRTGELPQDRLPTEDDIGFNQGSTILPHVQSEFRDGTQWCLEPR